MEPEKRLERSIDSLQRLYAGVIALALGQGLTKLFLVDRTSAAIAAWPDIQPRLPTFLAFFVVLVPFIHGMNRHLDDCYLKRRPNRELGPAPGALLFDFFVFFIEASILFVVATAVLDAAMAFECLGVLVFLDVVWAFVSWNVHYRGRPKRESPYPWILVNAGALVLGLLLGLSDVYPVRFRPWILMIVALGRTAADYSFCWKFYFPPGEGSEGDAANAVAGSAPIPMV